MERQQRFHRAGENRNREDHFRLLVGTARIRREAAAIAQVLLFAGKSDVVQSFRIELLQAAGPAGEKLPVDAASTRLKPALGILREVLRWENPRISNVPQMLMFTLPTGGWDNDALDDARLPADFSIDYVRVWQRRDLVSTTDTKQAATPPATR